MAKRKRLSLPLPGTLSGDPGVADTGPDRPALQSRAPIAQVAGDAAAVAAFHDVAGELTRAREDGRLVVSLPLDVVRADHLTRDRLTSDAEDMEALRTSIATRGQQTPIEVLALPGGGYGLISGWRRLQALRELARDDPERFGTVLALLRRPDTVAEAYRAMVEENEIRADLSFYERARIVQRAVDDGAFSDTKQALNTLFGSASYAKRSKIKSFLRVVEGLDGVLRHPTRLAEHLGLKLARALDQDASLPDRLARALDTVDPTDAEAELAAIKANLSHAKGLGKERSESGRAETGSKPVPAARYQPIGPGLMLEMDEGRIGVTGKRLSPDLVKRLEQWLRAQPEAR
ncbi:ParB/RepB/Spo0J family partition protein [Lacimonas salitolerans]|uniref:ParB/RepB/Spo0J family partition protein n=1 Tax=Lacimonas salitolerans TaxID=1323750 RepID=A0ABW4EA64_9RHOB